MSDKEIIYNYDVFISYRHLEEDKKWAKWLLESLETWRVPKELVKKGFPTRIGRVFRDEEELPSSSDLNKSIEEALIHSKYLVVICSKNTPESIWVEREIKMFKELGRFDRIIALLIDGEPYESFNKELTYTIENGVIKKIEPLAADVRKRNDQKEKEIKQIALLKILSCILGCNFDDLRQREKLREKRKLRNKLLIASSLAVILISALLFTWDYNRIKTTYYNNFVYQYGIPKGIGKLSKSQYSKRTITYVFEEQRRTLKSVKRVNSYGRLRDDENNFNISVWLPEIDTRGGVKRIVCKDHNNKIVMIREYSADLKIIELQNEFNLPFISGGNEIVRYEVSYNDDGYVTNELYYRDTWNTPISDKDGFYGKRYEVDDNGVVTSEYGINYDGDIEANREGIYKLQFNYDNNYNLIREEFIDENNNLIYIGNDYGYSYIERGYDKNGNLIKKSFFDENNQSIKSNYFGSASIVYNIDNRGNITNITSYDENNNLFLQPPSLTTLSYCMHNMIYDDKGNIVEGFLYDDKNNLYVSPLKYNKYKIKYDNNDNIIEESYYDANDNLIITINKYAIHKIQYDDKFNIIEESYYDINYKPVSQRENYHLVKYEYDNYNRIINKKYFDTDNKIILSFENNLSKLGNIKIKYDKRGNIIEEAYYDGKDNLILNYSNYSKKIINYNEMGYKIEESFYGINNNPIILSNGFYEINFYYEDALNFHKIKYNYDEKGNLIEKSFYDIYDKPISAKYFNTDIKKYYDIHKIKYDYSNSLLFKETFFNIDDNKINTSDNFNSIKYEDVSYKYITNLIKNTNIKIGNIKKISFYDKNENPIILKTYNYHTAYLGMDNNNRIEIYCDTNNQLTYYKYNNYSYSIVNIEINYNYHFTTKYYDVNNNIIDKIEVINNGNYYTSLKYFDSNENPAISESGYFFNTNTYDENYNLVSEKYYGTNNNLIENKYYNYAICNHQYDKNNREIHIQYLGTNEKPVMSVYGYSSCKINYNENGNASTNYYDEKGNEININ